MLSDIHQSDKGAFVVEVFVQRNAPLLIRQGLRTLLPDYKFVLVTNPTMDVHKTTFVTVSSDGTPGGGVATSSENVRVTVYAAYEPAARDLAVLIDSLLLSPSIEWGFSISPGAGLISAPDDDTGGHVASVTVVASSPKIERKIS